MLKGKTAVITGSSRGIGRATLEAFARNGANLYACARTETEEFEAFCAHLEDDHSVKIRRVYFDFSDEAAVKAAAKSILADKAPIDIIVNNAGMLGDSRLFTMLPLEDIRQEFDVNFFNPLLFTQALVKSMIRRKSGSIVNLASISGEDGVGVNLAYVASKAAVIGATKKLARELSPFGIRVNAISPGIVDTDMAAQMSDEQKSEVKDRVSMKREADPSEIANVALFLASDLSSYMTGQVVRVDGGM